MDQATMALAAHHRHEASGQVVPAEEIGLELLPQCRNRQVFDGARLCMGAIVEQGVEAPACSFQHRCHKGGDRLRLAVVEVKASMPSASSAAMSSGFRAVANTRQPSAFSAWAQ